MKSERVPPLISASLPLQTATRFIKPPLLLVGVQHVDALLLQALTQRHQRGNVRQRIARGLAQARHGTGGTGIDLDDRHMILRIDDELDIVPVSYTHLLKILVFVKILQLVMLVNTVWRT